MRKCRNCGGTAFRCVKCNRIMAREEAAVPVPPRGEDIAVQFRAAKDKGVLSAVQETLREVQAETAKLPSTEARPILDACIAACIAEM